MKSRIIASIVFTALCASCSPQLRRLRHGQRVAGQRDAVSLQQKIVKGKTTKAEIQAMFGEPSEKGTHNRREYWMCRLQTASAKTFIPFAGLATGNSGTEIKDFTIE